MARAQEHLTKVLQKITRPAVERLLEGEAPTGTLYDEDEEAELAEALASCYGTAHLFGQATVRLREQRLLERRGVKAFADRPTLPLSDEDLNYVATFGDVPLPPLKPDAALKYFLDLVPSLDVDVERWGDFLERRSFTLAYNTGELMLQKVQDTIARFALNLGGVGPNGEPVNEAVGRGKTGIAGRINEILEAAGVTPKNPQYAEMVARTNIMDGLNTGAQREQYAVRDTFPAYKYSAITRDGRARPSHAAKNGLIISVEIPFTEARGTDIKDVANCRCVPIPVDKWELDEYLKGGGRLITSLSELPHVQG
jgi:hypothetical protein